MIEQHLNALLHDRPETLKKAKKKGTKIIGYFPGGYVPEEIIYASGAIPICLSDGGDAQTADRALSIVPNVICPFARAQVGEMLLKTNPYYNMIDMLVVPSTCQHLKKTGDIWEYYENVEIFKLGIPYQHENDFELEYYTNRLRALKERIESLTGSEISNEKISGAIDLYNRLRELLRKISLARRDRLLPISAFDFIRLNHASFYADPVAMVDALEAIYKELPEPPPFNDSKKARLLLTGPNLARGDYGILKMMDATGSEIVAEELYEGIRYYWHNIKNNGDPIESLARGYLIERNPSAFMRSSTRKRLEFILKLIKDFNISGVIWYELLCCEFYDEEAYFFEKKFRELNIPMLVVESNYSISETGPLKTRLDAFIELIKGGPINA